jgi:hypothetical protein
VGKQVVLAVELLHESMQTWHCENTGKETSNLAWKRQQWFMAFKLNLYIVRVCRTLMCGGSKLWVSLNIMRDEQGKMNHFELRW